MRHRRVWKNRRGAAMVEAAVTTSLFLTMVFGMLDLGIALFRKQVVTEAAHQGARIASLHGYFAPNNSTMKAWGPNPPYYPPLPSSQSLYSSSNHYEVQSDNTSDDLANTIRPYLAGLDPSTVTIQIRWKGPDGNPDVNNALGSCNNDTGNRVTLTVEAPYQHIISFIFGYNISYVNASSTMTILH